MKMLSYLVLPIFLIFAGCGNNETNSNEKVQSNDMQAGSRSGEVIDKIDAGSYSYLQLKENDQIYWAAVPTMKIENGEQIFFSEYMEMKNFKSETLDRTFESVLFVNDANKVADKKTGKLKYLAHHYTKKEVESLLKLVNFKMVYYSKEIFTTQSGNKVDGHVVIAQK